MPTRSTKRILKELCLSILGPTTTFLMWDVQVLHHLHLGHNLSSQLFNLIPLIWIYIICSFWIQLGFNPKVTIVTSTLPTLHLRLGTILTINVNKPSQFSSKSQLSRTKSTLVNSANPRQWYCTESTQQQATAGQICYRETIKSLLASNTRSGLGEQQSIH